MEPSPIRPVELPVELEHKIFMTFARAHQPRSLVPLLLVAKRVKEWVTPEVFRAAIITNDETCTWSRNYPPVYPNGQDPNASPLPINPTFMRHAQHVRHALFDSTPAQQIIQVLDACPNINNLAVWRILNAEPNTEIFAAIDRIRAALPQLKRFSGYMLQVFPYPMPWELDEIHDPPGFDLRKLSQVTHLDFTYRKQGPFQPEFNWEYWKGLAQLPHLTHLTMTWRLSIGNLRRILENCGGLVYLIIDEEPYQATENEVRVHDARVVQYTKTAWKYVDEWEALTRTDVES